MRTGARVIPVRQDSQQAIERFVRHGRPLCGWGMSPEDDDGEVEVWLRRVVWPASIPTRIPLQDRHCRRAGACYDAACRRRHRLDERTRLAGEQLLEPRRAYEGHTAP